MVLILPAQVLDAIDDGSIYANPSLLASFVILSFADLKKYTFHYWFGFPAIHSDPPWTLTDNPRNLSHQESASLVDAVQSWSARVDPRQWGFFLARKTFHFPGLGSKDDAKISWKVASLDEYEGAFFDGARFEDSYICFADPSNYANAPGWMLRNLLVLIKRRWRLYKSQVLLFRDVRSKSHLGRSILMTLQTKPPQDRVPHPMPKVTGWERNPTGKLSGRAVDLTEYMDPKKLADQSVDLNLKLMKWRISPNLNLDKIKRTKCLLLGAGTLGSYVSRNLLVGTTVFQISSICIHMYEASNGDLLGLGCIQDHFCR